jgi:hypothetical protein
MALFGPARLRSVAPRNPAFSEVATPTITVSAADGYTIAMRAVIAT